MNKVTSGFCPYLNITNHARLVMTRDIFLCREERGGGGECTERGREVPTHSHRL